MFAQSSPSCFVFLSEYILFFVCTKTIYVLNLISEAFTHFYGSSKLLFLSELNAPSCYSTIHCCPSMTNRCIKEQRLLPDCLLLISSAAVRPIVSWPYLSRLEARDTSFGPNVFLRRAYNESVVAAFSTSQIKSVPFNSNYFQY